MATFQGPATSVRGPGLPRGHSSSRGPLNFEALPSPRAETQRFFSQGQEKLHGTFPGLEAVSCASWGNSELSCWILGWLLLATTHPLIPTALQSIHSYLAKWARVGVRGPSEDDRAEVKMFARGYRRDSGYRSPREPGLVRREELELQGKRDNRAGGTRQGRGRGSSTEGHFRPGTGFLCNANLTMVTMQHGKCT